MSKDTKQQGHLFVLSAPSGSGKSTVGNLALKQLPNMVYSVSYTTRAPRPGEIDGVNYNFVSVEKFKSMIANNEFLEWAEVFGKFYGTGREWVEDKLSSGLDVMADLDVVGAASVKKIMPEATFIFMVPPTAMDLSYRLKNRQTETPEEINRRLGQARYEIDSRQIFDFLLINDDLEKATVELINIILHGQGCPMQGTDRFWAEFFDRVPQTSGSDE